MLSNMHVERESLQTAMHHELLAIEYNYTNKLQVLCAVCALCVCVCACVRLCVCVCARARACQLSKRLSMMTRDVFTCKSRYVHVVRICAKPRRRMSFKKSGAVMSQVTAEHSYEFTRRYDESLTIYNALSF